MSMLAQDHSMRGMPKSASRLLSEAASLLLSLRLLAVRSEVSVHRRNRNRFRPSTSEGHSVTSGVRVVDPMTSTEKVE